MSIILSVSAIHKCKNLIYSSSEMAWRKPDPQARFLSGVRGNGMRCYAYGLQRSILAKKNCIPFSKVFRKQKKIYKKDKETTLQQLFEPF